MNEEEKPNMDISAKTVDTSTQRLELEVNGQKLWLDFEAFKREQEFIKQKENEWWEWRTSGQSTIDMFGAEGAKRVLEDQHRRDMRMIFNHRSRGKK
jgi:hypothetical protein